MFKSLIFFLNRFLLMVNILAYPGTRIFHFCNSDPKALSRHTMWNNLLTYFKENRTLVEGPLNDLRESAIQFVKPRPLKNNVNPGGRWNSNVMWDAREALVPGSVYDRSGRNSGGGYRHHDPMSRITSHGGHVPGMSVPVRVLKIAFLSEFEIRKKYFILRFSRIFQKNIQEFLKHFQNYQTFKILRLLKNFLFF